ncbi:hypothetical protein BH11BAC7_BH11BAC7_26310 [soil metagenome]
MKKITLTPSEELQELIDASVRKAINEVLPDSGTSPEDIGDISLAIKVTGLSRSKIYHAVQDETIPFIRCGRLIKFSRSDLTSWLRSRSSNKNS